MKLLVKLAWRNVLRNRRRTILSGLAVGITLASMILIDGIHIGMLESMIRTATDTFTGQGQIHATGFRDTLDVEKTIHNSDRMVKSLIFEEKLDMFAERTVSIAMISSPAGVNSVVMYGIEPDMEKQISLVDEAVMKGDYLVPGAEGQILIGSKTAEILEVETGDRVVLTAAQADTGELSQDMFRVKGIFHMDIREMDRGMAFIEIDHSRDLLALGKGTHEIALKFRNIDDAGDRSLLFWNKYSADGNEAIGWRDLFPQFDGMIDMTKIMNAISALLAFCIVSVIIMHALFMSLYERMFEFGILRAVGTRPLSMAMIIFIESASLSLISILFGLGLGFLVMQAFSIYGIDYKGIEFAGTTITELLYPAMTIRQFTLYPFLIFIFSLIAAIYPAVFAARMTPA
ncbi:MAG TPA: ABC transporter permease, partial [Nitrospirae bacterium]|nr:ABC transporter permease [Nitrospirota bacterium]